MKQNVISSVRIACLYASYFSSELKLIKSTIFLYFNLHVSSYRALLTLLILALSRTLVTMNLDNVT